MKVVSYEVSKSDGDKNVQFFSKETTEKNTVPDWKLFFYREKNK